MFPPLIFIVGCTGSGKSSLGRELARRLNGEIISIDSMKVYRRMDIGTAKASRSVQREIPHHMIDVVEPSEEFSVAQYVRHAENAIHAIRSRGRPILVVGGTALYIKALTEGLFDGPSADPVVRAALHKEAQDFGQEKLHARLQQVDPDASSRIHPNDLRRIVRALEVYELSGQPISKLQSQWDRERTKYDCEFFGIRRDIEDQNHRTNLRVKGMLEEGFVDEVRSLLSEPDPLSSTAARALGYAEMIRHLHEEISLAEAVELIKINTRRMAKSQRTWFKRFRQTCWLDVGPDTDTSEAVEEILKHRGTSWSA